MTMQITEVPEARTLPYLRLGTPENVVYPVHPRFEKERVRVGYVIQSKSWILITPPDAISKHFRHLAMCTEDTIVDLEMLDSAGLIERECDGPPGSYVVRLSSKALK